MQQLTLFDAPPALVDPLDRVCGADEIDDTITLGDRHLGLRIELARHTDGRFMWGIEFHTPTGGQGYRVGPKWGNFAPCAIEALQRARVEIADRAAQFQHGKKVVQLLGRLDS